MRSRYIPCAWFTSVTLFTSIGLNVSSPAIAQRIPDTSLGAENSIVTEGVIVRGGNADRIDGGAIRGNNLFHSFESFNVGNNERVYFANPDNIERILTRVTGNDVSDILGTLGVDGNADLFLLNPNGIFFGPNAQLDLRGSFVATTANGFQFPNNFEFSAIDPQSPPLLTVSVPLGLQYGMNPPGAIAGQNSILSVNSDQSLLLMGGNITLDTTQLRVVDSVGGNIALVGIGGAGTVHLLSNENGLQVSVPNNLPRADITLRNGTRIEAIGPEGGQIDLEAQNLKMSNFSSVSTGIAPGIDAPDRQAGNISVNATQAITLDSGFILNTLGANGTGNAGDILVTGETLTLDGGSQITSITYGTGDAGSISINVQESVVLEGNLLGLLPSAIYTASELNATGDGGSIDLSTGTLTLQDGAYITANVLNEGNSGDITINAQDSIWVRGENRLGTSSLINSSVLLGAIGDAGDITISTGNLTLLDGGQINASIDGTGNTGTIQVDVRDTTRIRGINSRGIPSAIANAIPSGAIGNSRDITLNTGSLFLLEGGQINSSTAGSGHAGSIAVTVRDRLIARGEGEIEGNPDVIISGIFNLVDIGAVGDAGDITITANHLSLQEGSFISSDTFGEGDAGAIRVTVQEDLIAQGESSLGNGSGIFSRVAPGAAGNAAGITLTAGNLSLLGGAQISSATFGQGNAGDMTVTVQGNLIAQGLSSLGERSGITSGVFFGLEGTQDIDRIRAILLDAGDIQTKDRQSLIELLNSNGNEDIEIIGAIGDAGDVTITTGQLSLLDGAQINASTLSEGDAGRISVEAQEFILLRGDSSSIRSFVWDEATGSSAGIRLRTPLLSIQNGAEMNTSTAGFGNAGDVRLQVSDAIQLNQGTISTETSAHGNSGDIWVESDRLSLTNSSITSTSTSTASPESQGGDITIAVNRLNVSGENSGILAETQGEAAAGSVTIRTDNEGDRLVITLADNARISAATSGAAHAGRLRISAPGTLVLQGIGQLSAETSAEGEAGDITLSSQRLVVRDGAQVSVNSMGNAIAGDLTVEAEQVRLDQGSGLTAETEAGSGGNITLRIADALTLDRTSVISASTIEGLGGRVTLSADDLGSPVPLVRLSNGSRLETEATGRGDAGAIRLNVLDLMLGDRSSLSASTTSGTSGSIQLPDLVTLTLDNSTILASTQSGEAGSIFVQATDAINFIGNSGLSVEGNDGTAGNIRVRTPHLHLQDGAFISATTTTGSGGDITLWGLDTLELEDGAIAASTQSGEAGSIQIEAQNAITLDHNAQISVAATAGGEAGGLDITTTQLNLNNYSEATVSSTRRGRSGDLSVAATTTSLNNDARIAAETRAGQGGNITIHVTDALQLNHGSEISALTWDGVAGTIVINGEFGRSDRTRLIPWRARGNPDASSLPVQRITLDNSRISTEARRSGDAGEIEMTTEQLLLTQDSSILASTVTGNGGQVLLQGMRTLEVQDSAVSASTASGRAGSVRVYAHDSIQLNGNSTRLAVEATDENGVAGDLSVATDQLWLNEGAAITVSSPEGQAGNLTVTTQQAQLFHGAITAVTGQRGEGDGANIRVNAPNFLLLRDGSLISAEALGDANGGNVTIDNRNSYILAIATENSDIVANAFEGDGGRINILTQGLFGIQFREELTPLSDINASSELGSAGIVAIEGPVVDPTRGLIELPTGLVDVSRLVGQQCPGPRSQVHAADLGEFYVTGSGGLPVVPYEPRSASAVITSWVTVESGDEPSAIAPEPPQTTALNSTENLVEITSWTRNESGELILIAGNDAHLPLFVPLSCDRL